MKFKRQLLVEPSFNASLDKFAQADLPIKKKLEIAKMIRAIRLEFDIVSQVRQNVVERLTLRKPLTRHTPKGEEEKVFNEKTGEQVMSIEYVNEKELNAKIKELYEGDVSVDFSPIEITEAELEKAKFHSEDIANQMDLIEIKG